MSAQTPEPIVEWIVMDGDGRVVGSTYTKREDAETFLAELAPGTARLWQKKVTLTPVSDDAVWEFYDDFGRMGVVKSTFVLSKTTMEKLLDAEPWFYVYDVLGKHSEIPCRIDREHVTLLTNDPAEVASHKPTGNVDVLWRLQNGEFRAPGKTEDECFAFAKEWFGDS